MLRRPSKKCGALWRSAFVRSMPGLSKFSQSNALIAAALAIFPLVAFSRVFNNGFVNWDDGAYITENSHVLSGLIPESIAWAWQTTSCGNWHPLTWISLEADAQLFGVLPWGFHLTNVLFHAATALLLFHVLERMTGALAERAGRRPSGVAPAARRKCSLGHRAKGRPQHVPGTPDHPRLPAIRRSPNKRPLFVDARDSTRLG